MALFFPCSEALSATCCSAKRAVCSPALAVTVVGKSLGEKVLRCLDEDSNKRIKLPARNFYPGFCFNSVVPGRVSTPRSNFCRGCEELVSIPVHVWLLGQTYSVTPLMLLN